MNFESLQAAKYIHIGNCELKGIVFTSVSKDNGMYNSLYRPVLGRTVLENIGWKFDMDNSEMTMFALNNEKLLSSETEYFSLAKGEVNKLQLYSKETDTLNTMFHLGSNYDIKTDKITYDKLRQNNARVKSSEKQKGTYFLAVYCSLLPSYSM